MRCPCCGANLIYKNDVYSCEFCGYEENIKKTTPAPNYNLAISHSNGTSSVITVIIRDSNISHPLKVNSTASFKLTPGPHEIEFREGGRVNRRIVTIPDNGEVLNVDYSFDFSRREPVIIRVGDNGTGTIPLRTSNMPQAEKNTMSIVSLVLALVGLNIPSIVLSSINASKARKMGMKPSTMDTLAQVISYLYILFKFAIISAIARGS